MAITQAISPLGPVPTTDDPAGFPAAADNFLAVQLPRLQSELDVFGEQANDLAEEVNAAAAGIVSDAEAAAAEVLASKANVDDLASAAEGLGSRLVAFLQTGTGAVPTTVESKLRERSSVYDFGAVGDGVADDTAAIQAGIDANLNGTLYFPPGRFLVSAATGSAALLLDSEDIRLQGAGRAESVICAASACVMFAAVDGTNVTVDGLGFDGESETNLSWQRGVWMRGVVNGTISNCRFYRMGDGPVNFSKVGFGGTDSVANGTRQCENITFIDNLIEDSYGTVAVLTKPIGAIATVLSRNIIRRACASGISMESETSTTEYAEKLVITDNIVDDISYERTGGFSPIATGIGVGERARHVTISGNIVTNILSYTISQGITLDTAPAQTDAPISQVSATGNVISGVTSVAGYGHGFLVQTGDADASQLVISSNVITGCTVGVTLSSAIGAKTLGEIMNSAINANVISGCERGIWGTTLDGAGDTAALSFAITDNNISDCEFSGISGKFMDSVFSGNVVSNCGTDGFFTATGSSGNLFSGNEVTYCGARGMALNGDRASILGNIVMNNGQDTAVGTTYGIYVISGANCVLSLNRVGDSQGAPTQDYGVRAPSGSTIRSNELIGNISGGVWGGIASHNTGTYDAGLNRTA